MIGDIQMWVLFVGALGAAVAGLYIIWQRVSAIVRAANRAIDDRIEAAVGRIEVGVSEVHALVNSASDAQKDLIAALHFEISELKDARNAKLTDEIDALRDAGEGDRP